MDKPRLWEIWKQGYSPKTLVADTTAGLVVGIVAIPLAVAFAIASGVTPDKGLLTAVVAGFLISALGGSHVQIGGPTGAFIVIVYGIIQRHGVDGLILATLMAGVFLLILGFARLGTVIQFIPYPVIVGFTSGIAVTIATSQVNDFLGLGLTGLPADFLEKWGLFLGHLDRINPWAVGLGLGTIGVVVGLARWDKRIPGALVALVVGTLAVEGFRLPLETIGSRFGEISGALPWPSLPAWDLAKFRDLLMPAFSIAMLAAIESLLSAVVADGLTGGKHNSNQELVGQGVANIASALFGGIPATGAIARTATNIRSGAQTPVAGLVHALFLLLVLLFLSPLTAHIPMAVLAGILFVVSFNMSEHRNFRLLVRGPRQDRLVLVVTFLLTVLIDLTVAIPVGILFALLFFLGHMSRASQVTLHRGELRDAPEELDPFGLTKMTLPEGVEVVEIEGPLFFGAAERFKEALSLPNAGSTSGLKVRILRFRRVPSLDASGARVLQDLVTQARARGVALLFASVGPEVHRAMQRFGLVDLVGEEQFLPDLVAAVDRALVLGGRAERSVAERVRCGGSKVSDAADPLALIRDAADLFPLATPVRDALVASMLEREVMASTALGRGLAFPHPRNPLPGTHDQEFVSVVYPRQALAWGPAGGPPVKAVFLLASTSVPSHLKTLAALAKAAKDASFQALLDRQAGAEEIAQWLEARS